MSILRHVKISSGRGLWKATSITSSVTRALRNSRLLMGSATQHLIDDPALFALQVSRRLPLSVRTRAGHVLDALASRARGGTPLAALGAFMAGETGRASQLLSEESQSRSRLHGEVAVLLDQVELVADGAPAATRARAAWSLGDISGAVQILESAGQGESAHARRLRSEARMLTDGFQLTVPAAPGLRADLRDGEPLRVLHLITNSLPHTQSGYSLRTHKILTRLRDHGIESVALTRTGYPVMIGKPWCGDEDEVDGIRYLRTLPDVLGDTPESRLQQEVERALQIVRDVQPHVLHATTDYRNALVARAVSAATGIPWILEVRGLMEQTWIASHRSDETRLAAENSEKVRLIRAREGELARSASAVVTLSETMAGQLVERGVERDRITLVPNGVDEALFTGHVSVTEARRQVGLHLPTGAFAIGAVSALVDYEGFDVLLRAAAKVIGDSNLAAELRENLHVVLVGDGVAAPSLAELASELGIEDRVHLPGRVPPAEARRWVEVLDVVTVPRLDRSVSRTVTPQKPVEALALSRPIVISDLPALRETVTGRDGVLNAVLSLAGSVDDLAVQIARIAQDSDRRARLGAEGLLVARERTWPMMMRRYDRTYRLVVGATAEESSSGE